MNLTIKGMLLSFALHLHAGSTTACSSASSATTDVGSDGTRSDARPDAAPRKRSDADAADAETDASMDHTGPHTVTLNWHASSTPGVTYTVFRSTTVGTDYESLAAGISALTWTDISVEPGTTYYYVVSDSIGPITSGYSNQAVAIIP
jgi:hypothetical protein